MFDAGADSHHNSSEFIQPSGLGYDKRDRSCSASVPADPMAVHDREVASTWLPVTVCALQCKRILSRRKRCSVNEQCHDTTVAVHFLSFRSFPAVLPQFFEVCFAISGIFWHCRSFFVVFFGNICTAVFCGCRNCSAVLLFWSQKLQENCGATLCLVGHTQNSHFAPMALHDP